MVNGECFADPAFQIHLDNYLYRRRPIDHWPFTIHDLDWPLHVIGVLQSQLYRLQNKKRKIYRYLSFI